MCDSVKPPKTPTRIPIPPLPAVPPPVNLVHRDVIRAWCQQLKLSTKGPKLEGYTHGVSSFHPPLWFSGTAPGVHTETFWR